MSRYQDYRSALEAVRSLPEQRESELRILEQRLNAEITTLDRSAKDDERHWKELSDSVNSLEQRHSKLCTQAGLRPTADPAAQPLTERQLRPALETVERDLAKAEQSWQWILRHRERAQRAAQAPQPTPTPAATPLPVAPAPAPTAPEPTGETRGGIRIPVPVLLAIGVVVLGLLLAIVLL